MRGEHVDFAPRATALPGSSPHTRGAPVVFEHHGIAHGIIPACAGSTREHPSLSAINWDHPRIRGEHLDETFYVSFRTGIIPAYAGSTMAQNVNMIKAGDHPRIRGEHSPRTGKPVANQGSSPHTRGAPRLDRERAARRGIIPAYAGSTTAGGAASAARGDHPRIRGEHPSVMQGTLRRAGSSPHTRGALLIDLYVGC